MTGLLRRVAALERFARRARDEACAECGGPPESRRYRLEFNHREWGAPAEAVGPERCPACGRRLVLGLEFDRSG